MRSEAGRSKHEREKDQFGDSPRPPGERPAARTCALLGSLIRKQMEAIFWWIGFGAEKVGDDKDDP